MPLYEYQCEACGARFELIRKFSDPPLDVCSTCGSGPVQKLISSPAFQFKGSGWYITDYARKSGGGDSKADKSSSAEKSSSSGSDEGSSSTKSSESGSDSKGSSTGNDSTKNSSSKDSGGSDKPAATPSTTKGS